jgi:hypothetical protein
MIDSHNGYKCRLLTPQEVADLLQISVRTVYGRALSLGGFYPAGIGVLRFNQEVIYGIMEGQKSQGVVLQFRVPEEKLCREGIRNKKGRFIRSRRTEEISKEASEAAPGRHGF